MHHTRRIMLGAAMACVAAVTVPSFAAKPLVMGFSQVGAESEWRTANTRSIKDAASAAGITLRQGEVTPDSLARDGFCGEPFDALVSCLASRTGTSKDAWAIDHHAHVLALEAAKAAGVTQVVLLSAEPDVATVITQVAALAALDEISEPNRSRVTDMWTLAFFCSVGRSTTTPLPASLARLANW